MFFYGVLFTSKLKYTFLQQQFKTCFSSWQLYHVGNITYQAMAILKSFFFSKWQTYFMDHGKFNSLTVVNFFFSHHDKIYLFIAMATSPLSLCFRYQVSFFVMIARINCLTMSPHQRSIHLSLFPSSPTPSC